MIMTGLLIILWNLEICSARSDNVAFQYNVICIYIGVSSVVILAPNISIYIAVYHCYSICVYSEISNKKIIQISNICYFNRFYRKALKLCQWTNVG